MIKPMSLQARQAMLNSMRERYQSGTWTVKNKLLNSHHDFSSGTSLGTSLGNTCESEGFHI